jgi:uncharacterized protein (TIGR02996 family)
MSAEQGFLEQLAAQPGDDTTRLVYADWLEERGDPRGAYLRWEVKLAALEESDPRYPSLERELLLMRFDLDPGWIDRAGRGYDVVLLRCEARRRQAAPGVIVQLTGGQWIEVQRLLDGLPAPLLEGVSRARAEFARERLRSLGSLEVCIRPSAAKTHLLRGFDHSRGWVLVLRQCLTDSRGRPLMDLGSRTGLGTRELSWLVDRLPAPIAWFARREEGPQEDVGTFVAAAFEVRLARDAPPVVEPPTYGLCEVVLEAYPDEARPDVMLALHELTGESLHLCRKKALKLPCPVHRGVGWELVRRARERFPAQARLVVRPLP